MNGTSPADCGVSVRSGLYVVVVVRGLGCAAKQGRVATVQDREGPGRIVDQQGIY